MAQVTEVRLVDDLDGGTADESVEFAIDNKHYEMDLSEKHAAQLRDVLAPFIAAARRAGGSAVTRTRRSTTSVARPPAAREETAAIREWASANGFEVSSRGRIAASVREAYENREKAASAALAVETPTVEAEAKPKRRTRKKVADPFTAE
ncbi:MAG TPA: Lsr2 family protein [Pseudonocardia sp.]